MRKTSPLLLGAALIVIAFGTKVMALTEGETSAPPMPNAQMEPVMVIEDVGARPADLAAEIAAEKSVAEREAALADREGEIAEREQALAALELRIRGELDDLQAVRDELVSLRDAIITAQSEDLARLSAVYGNMKARDAAEVLNTMGAPMVVKIMDGMSPQQATAVMGALDAKLAKEVTSTILMRTELD